MVVGVSTGKVQHEKIEPAPALVSSYGWFVSRWPLMLYSGARCWNWLNVCYDWLDICLDNC